MKRIVVRGRRWFSKTYGNTYFTATIDVDGERVADLPEEYGYGDYYLQAAREKLVQLGLIPEDNTRAFAWWCRENGIELDYSAEDVARKRDL